tara:strand:+ start:1139 stop:1351 length:213 start_codon:yes stop_codon:yes gene_type:complete
MSSHSDLLDEIIDCQLAAQDTSRMCLELAGTVSKIRDAATEALKLLQQSKHDYYSMRAVKKIEEIIDATD